MHTILIYIHLIVSHDSFQRQAVQHKKYFECFPVQQCYQLLLQMFLTQHRSPPPPQTNKNKLTAVLQTKHILQEPWHSVSDYVQSSCLKLGWEK